jgi:carbonic anhydrase/acetyltransferase-like protein (isoleucine patch superfamily)
MDSNIQEGAVVQNSPGTRTLEGFPTKTFIGSDVTIGKKASVTSATIGSDVLIGDGAVICEGVCIDDYVVVAKG